MRRGGVTVATVTTTTAVAALLLLAVAASGQPDCGRLGQGCCEGDRPCQEENAVCWFGTCESCGGEGERCCAGDACGSDPANGFQPMLCQPFAKRCGSCGKTAGAHCCDSDPPCDPDEQLTCVVTGKLNGGAEGSSSAGLSGSVCARCGGEQEVCCPDPVINGEVNGCDRGLVCSDEVKLNGRNLCVKTPGEVASGNVILLDSPKPKDGFSTINPLYEGSGYWATRAPMPFKRSDHQVAAVDDFVYIIGGIDGSGNVTDDVTIYDTVLDSYQEGPTLPVALYRFGIALLPGQEGMSDGRIYIFGGLASTDFDEPASDKVFVLDVKTGEWSNGPKLLTGRTDLCGQGVDGKVYAVGGWPTGFTETLDSVEVLDPEEGEWKELSSTLPTPRGDLKCGILGDDVLVVVGGFYDPLHEWRPTQFRNEVEAFNTTTEEWSFLADMSNPRGDVALVSLPGERLLVIGGETHSRGQRTQVATNQVSEYVAAHDSWIKKVPVPESRFRMDATYVDGVVFLFGGHAICDGEDDCPETKTVQAYFDIDHPDVFLASK